MGLDKEFWRVKTSPSNFPTASGFLKVHKSPSHVPAVAIQRVMFPMTKFRVLLATLILAALALQTLGGGSMSNTTSNRVLQSIAVTPAIADAQSFPNGHVQFKAIGTFSQPPSPDQVTFVAPYSGGWAVTANGTSDVSTITANGLAQCLPRCASGTVSVIATASASIRQLLSH